MASNTPLLTFEDFCKEWDCEWFADLEDDDYDGETIIRPHQAISMPNEKKMREEVFKKHITEMPELLEVASHFELSFGGGLSAKFTRRNK